MSESQPLALEVRSYYKEVLLDTQHHLASDGAVHVSDQPRWSWDVLGVPLLTGTSAAHRVLRFLPPLLSEVRTAPELSDSLSDDVVGRHTLFEWKDDEVLAHPLPEWSASMNRDDGAVDGSPRLAKGDVLTIHRGDVRITAAVVNAPRRLASRPSDEVDLPFIGTLSLGGFAMGLAAVLLWTAPPPVTHQATTAFQDLHEHVVQLQVPPEPEPVAEAAPEPEAAPEEGAAAPEPEGKTGKREALQEDAGRSESANERDTEMAMSAGVLAAWSAAGMDSLGENLMGGGLANSIGSIDGPAGVARGTGLGRVRGGIGGGGTAEGLGGWGPRGNGPGGNPFGDGDGDCQTCMTREEGAIATFSEPIVIGHVDRSLISEVVQRHIAQIRYCYSRELARHPDLSGKVVVQFAITPQGEVSRASTKESTLGNLEVESCINGRFMRMGFPEIGTMAVVSYPFLFSAQ